MLVCFVAVLIPIQSHAQEADYKRANTLKGISPALPTPFSKSHDIKQGPQKPKLSPQPSEYKPDFEQLRTFSPSYIDQLIVLVRGLTGKCLTIAGNDYKQVITECQSWYTDKGWADYQKYMKQHKVHQWLNQTGTIAGVEALGISSPVLIGEMRTKSGYKWSFRIDKLRRHARYTETSTEEYDYVSVYLDLLWIANGREGHYQISKFKVVKLQNLPDKRVKNIQHSIPDNGDFRTAATISLNKLFQGRDNRNTLLRYASSVYLETMLNSYSLNGKDIDAQLSELQKYYTRSGWVGYMEQISESDILSSVKTGAQLISAPHILRTKLKNIDFPPKSYRSHSGGPRTIKNGKMGGLNTWLFTTTIIARLVKENGDAMKEFIIVPRSYISLIEFKDGIPDLRVSTFHHEKILPFDKPFNPYDKMSSKEMTDFMKARCQKGGDCKPSYSEALILSRKIRDEQSCLYRNGSNEERAFIPSLDKELPCFSLTGRTIKSWSVKNNSITFLLTPEGTEELFKRTKKHLKSKLAVFYGKKFVTAPVIMEIIDHGMISVANSKELVDHLPPNKKR